MARPRKPSRSRKKIIRDPLEALGVSRENLSQSRLGQRILALSKKKLPKNINLIEELAERFKEGRS